MLNSLQMLSIQKLHPFHDLRWEKNRLHFAVFVGEKILPKFTPWVYFLYNLRTLRVFVQEAHPRAENSTEN